IGSADIYSAFTSQALFNGQVTVMFSTDGKFMIEGKLNFFAGSLSISGKLYADLSNVTSGKVTVLFLADIPDQEQDRDLGAGDVRQVGVELAADRERAGEE